MSYASHTNSFLSCGLDSSLYFSNIERAVSIKEEETYFPSKIVLNGSSSIYACAMTSTSSLCAVGGTDSIVRLFDPKSLKKTAKLRGHSDNIHALLISEDGNRLISAGSDKLIKFWDLRVQKCLYSVNLHESTVFSLKFNGSEDKILSGGKDGCVYQTDFVTLESNLICQESKPILSLETNPSLGVFVSTTSSNVTLWDLEAGPAIKAVMTKKPIFMKTVGTPTTTPQKVFTKKPLCVLPGSAGIIKSFMLSNKTKVLTLDTEGVVALWDIRKGILETSFGVVNVEEKFKELNEVISVDNWFTVDNKLGCVQIVLDPPRCFNSEVYAIEGGFENSGSDDKVNYGQLMVVALFRNWLEKRKWTLKEGEEKKHEDRKKRDEKIRFELPHNLTVIVHHEKESEKKLPFVKKIGEFDGSEDVFVPDWIQKCYYLDAPEGTTNHKITFQMESFDVKQLENFSSNKLTAHRILRVTKVCDYVVTQLKLSLPKMDDLEAFRKEINKEVAVDKRQKMMETFVAKLKKKTDVKDPVKPEELIEVLCNGHIISHTYNMGIIYTFFRENQPMVILKYRIKL